MMHKIIQKLLHCLHFLQKFHRFHHHLFDPGRTELKTPRSETWRNWKMPSLVGTLLIFLASPQRRNRRNFAVKRQNKEIVN